MRHLRSLIESRPFLTRVPDQSIIVSDQGSGRGRVQATRSSDGSYAFVYAPLGGTVTVDMSKISGAEATAWWFDPRTGEATAIGHFPCSGAREFTAPSEGLGEDWVLVLDDASAGFPPPGQAPGR